MARIRTIKPEFWTDEKIVELPFEARLFFVGLWNFADDNGRLWNEPIQLKMRIFPADAVDVADLIDLLEASGLLFTYNDDQGRSVLEIAHFTDHQRISHPSASKIPAPPFKKRNIPLGERRRLAVKYGCPPGESIKASCSMCEASGRIIWTRTQTGRPAGWVIFADLEIDHVTPESAGGSNAAENLVLSCRSCNRSRGARQHPSIAPEPSGVLPPERKGKEGNGVERNGSGVERNGLEGNGGEADPVSASAAPGPPRESGRRDDEEYLPPGDPRRESLVDVAQQIGVPISLRAMPGERLTPEEIRERKERLKAQTAEITRS